MVSKSSDNKQFIEIPYNRGNLYISESKKLHEFISDYNEIRFLQKSTFKYLKVNKEIKYLISRYIFS